MHIVVPLSSVAKLTRKMYLFTPPFLFQAKARCHRIGQTKAVKVYRLVTSKTYEHHMLQCASIKLGLDKAVMSTVSKSKADQVLPHIPQT